MNAIPTIISLSVIKNHEFQTHESILRGLGGQLKNGDTFSGTGGEWFQPLSGVLFIFLDLFSQIALDLIAASLTENLTCEK